MSTAALATSDLGSLIRDGWAALVDKLGLLKATEFVLLIERGRGDSVQEIAEYWGDSNIDEVHKRVLDWVARKEGATSV